MYAKLGLGPRRSDADHQHAFVSAEIFRIQDLVEDAARGAGDQADPGEVQEIFDARSAQTGDEQGMDGSVQPRRHQPGGRMHSAAIADADMSRVVPSAAVHY